MAALPIEWALVIFYGPSAHRATYGRLDGRDTKYTKDFIQLSRKADFLQALASLFPVSADHDGSVPITYRWPLGETPGALVFNSADRPHLKWETHLGAPKAWKMTLAPSETTEETIPGNPSHLEFDSAEEELALLSDRGAGQPYLLAVKLRDQPRTLHLRVYLDNPSPNFSWADLKLAPQAIQDLAASTSQKSALASSLFLGGGSAPTAKVTDALALLETTDNYALVVNTLDEETGRALTNYLLAPGHGLFFDPTRNHDAWAQAEPLTEKIAESIDDLLLLLKARFPPAMEDDAAAETLDTDPEDVEAFVEQIEQKNYEVLDSTMTVKSRGSAQKAFADAVKGNYEYRCAITGIATKDFLVASHIVPWSKDQSIRLDPTNGICLSLLVDRAFEKGYLQVEDDLTIRIDWVRVGDDEMISAILAPYDGQPLRPPTKEAPKAEYLQRRRALVAHKK